MRPAVITRVLFAGLAGLVGLSLTACTPPVRGPVKVVERDSGSMIELHVGDQVEIVLAGNPTTGYVWEVGSPDITVVRQVGDPQFKPDSEAVGAGGTLTLLFEAIAPGEQMLGLIYHRTFEQGVPAAKTFALDILVRQR
jgi:inhibitor of cysteine peptidase